MSVSVYIRNGPVVQLVSVIAVTWHIYFMNNRSDCTFIVFMWSLLVGYVICTYLRMLNNIFMSIG